MFKLEAKDDTAAETLITEDLTCPVTGIIYRWKNFGLQFLYSSAGTAKVSVIRPNHVCPKQDVLSVGRVIIILKRLPNKEKSSQNVPIVMGHMLHPTKGVQDTKPDIWTTCGGQPKIVCLNSTPKLGSPITPGQDIHMFGRTSRKTGSKCSHSIRSATSLPRRLHPERN